MLALTYPKKKKRKPKTKHASHPPHLISTKALLFITVLCGVITVSVVRNPIPNHYESYTGHIAFDYPANWGILYARANERVTKISLRNDSPYEGNAYLGKAYVWRGAPTALIADVTGGFQSTDPQQEINRLFEDQSPTATSAASITIDTTLFPAHGRDWPMLVGSSDNGFRAYIIEFDYEWVVCWGIDAIHANGEANTRAANANIIDSICHSLNIQP